MGAAPSEVRTLSVESAVVRAVKPSRPIGWGGRWLDIRGQRGVLGLRVEGRRGLVEAGLIVVGDVVQEWIAVVVGNAGLVVVRDG